jgi:uncharacterized membrane protein (TIGR02234 family)
VAALAGAGAVCGLLAAARPWVTAEVSVAPGTPGLSVVAAGRDLAPLVPVLALVGLTGALALPLVTRWTRFVVASIVGLSGLGLVADAAGRLGDLVTVGGSLAARGSPGALVAGTATATVWPWVAVAGGVALTAAGVLGALGAHRWPGLSSAYDRPTPPPAGVTGTRDPDDFDSLAAWNALDAGDDPTR